VLLIHIQYFQKMHLQSDKQRKMYLYVGNKTTPTGVYVTKLKKIKSIKKLVVENK